MGGEPARPAYSGVAQRLDLTGRLTPEFTRLRVGKDTRIIYHFASKEWFKKRQGSKSGTTNCWAAAMD